MTKTPEELRTIAEGLKPADLKGLLSRPGRGDFRSSTWKRLVDAGLMDDHFYPTELGYAVRDLFPNSRRD